MADLNALLGQLIQGQIDLQNHIAALAAAQPQPAPPAHKKVVAVSCTKQVWYSEHGR